MSRAYCFMAFAILRTGGVAWPTYFGAMIAKRQQCGVSLRRHGVFIRAGNLLTRSLTMQRNIVNVIAVAALAAFYSPS
jgi:hypothetical protein